MNNLKDLEGRYLKIESRAEEVLSSCLSEALSRARKIVISKGRYITSAHMRSSGRALRKGKF